MNPFGYAQTTISLLLLTFCVACTSAGTRESPGCPQCVQDDDIDELYASRTWRPPSQLDIDAVALGTQAEIPVNATRSKIIGPDYEDSVASLAAKIWLIDNARHTVDAVYYIFKRDLVGYAVLGALCNAVERGVDIRIMVDSTGSFHPTHDELRALETCAENAGWMLTLDGRRSTRRARVQVVIFNALSKVFTRFNRRSHDKLLVVDGWVPERAVVITGGRNISNAYYGINEDGSEDPTAYRDLEIVLRPSEEEDSEYTVGSVSEIYYSILLAYKHNRRLKPQQTGRDSYPRYRQKARDSLAFLMQVDTFRRQYNSMPQFMTTDFRVSDARLAHELGNLVSGDVVASFQENLKKNPNSITGLLAVIGEEGPDIKTMRLVSPYLLLPQYKDAQGNLIEDGKAGMEQWLAEDPERRVEIVSNSVMTSDNFFAQSIIDMDTAPLMLLDEESLKLWQASLQEGELNPALVESPEWQAMVSNPRIEFYQTGRMDARLLGGDNDYGKLHAKFVIADNLVFVGTTNMDHRSRLYNNELGFFVYSAEVSQDLVEVFEELKAQSYRWGSPEWLEMRKQLRATDTDKGSWARKQRSTFTRLRRWGLEWQF